MANSAIFKSSDGAVFVQSRGARTRARFIGCVDVDALTEPGGALDTLIRCFREDGQGWRTLDATITPPDPVTTTITTLVEGTANSLELARSGLANLFIHQRAGGRSDTFSNYQRSWALERVFIGEKTATDLAMREEDNPSTMAFGISALPPIYRIFQKTSGRQTHSVPAAINAIHFCGTGADLDQVGVAASDAVGAGSPADAGDVLYTLDGGATWTATATTPFAAGEDVGGVTCFLMGRNTTRIVAARGDTDAGNPAEIAYSDDWGATWNRVNVGSTNGQYVFGPHGLFALDPYNIWMLAGAGYIYKSDDGGISWDVQDAGIATTNDLYAIHFINDRVGYAVGEADTILKTEDGGLSWTATANSTGVNVVLRSVYVIDPDVVWVGTAGGRLFYTEDGGETWTEKTFAGSGTGIVTAVQFAPGTELFGFMLHQTTGPVGTVFSTIDGGYSWDPVTTFTNAGLNALAVIDLNNAFFTGELQGGTGIIGKVFPKP